jgi:hypothetical protein
MPVQWTQDVDAALATGRERGQHILLDFSAAPA